MNRRTFLTRLASGIVGVSLVDVEWVPTPIARHLPTVTPAELLTDINQITAEFLRLVVRDLPGFQGQFVADDYQMGGCAGFNCRHAMWAQVPEVGGTAAGVQGERELLPLACQIADAIVDKRITTFGALPVPHNIAGDAAVATDQRSGVTVRGICAYDLGMDHTIEHDDGTEEYVEGRPGWLYRFDILGKAA